MKTVRKDKATTDLRDVQRTQGTTKIKREGLDGIKFSQAFLRVGPSSVHRCHRLEIDGQDCRPVSAPSRTS